MKELVLTFHGIGVPHGAVDPDEIGYWATPEVYRDIIAKTAAFAARTGMQVLVTFDDGNKSDIEIGAPELLKHGLRGIFFPCAGRLEDPAYLSPDDIRSLSKNGFGIGSHGHDHVLWRDLDAETQTLEIVESRKAIGAVCGYEITNAALPFGGYDRTVLKAISAAGYTAIYSSDPGLSDTNRRFRERYSYRTDRGIDVAAIATQFAKPSHRAVIRAKHLIKSMR